MSDTIKEQDAAREDELARQEAIKQIERKRRYLDRHRRVHRGIPNVWNIWIIYPAMAWLFLTAVGGLIAYLRKPISESQIRREIERQNRS